MYRELMDELNYRIKATIKKRSNCITLYLTDRYFTKDQAEVFKNN